METPVGLVTWGDDAVRQNGLVTARAVATDTDVPSIDIIPAREAGRAGLVSAPLLAQTRIPDATSGGDFLLDGDPTGMPADPRRRGEEIVSARSTVALTSVAPLLGSAV